MTKRRFRILSFDGGGVRGVLSARLLERVVREWPALLTDVDMLAGTSTGGIIALALAADLHPSEVRALYERHSKAIFHDTIWDDVHDMGDALGAKYSQKGLEHVLSLVLKDWTLSDLRKLVLVPAFDLRGWAPKFFHNIPGEDSDGKESVIEVALRTSAAPVYFPSRNGFADGGLFANDPAACALAEALSDKMAAIAPEGRPYGLDEVAVLSIGTGIVPRTWKKRDDLGWLAWAPAIAPTMIEASQGTAAYICRQQLRDRYQRLNVTLPRTMELDDVKSIPELLRIADAVDLTDTLRWLRSHWSLPINVDEATSAA